MKIQFLYFSDCPNHEMARKNLMEAISEAKIKHYEIEEIEIKSEDDALKYRSPARRQLGLMELMLTQIMLITVITGLCVGFTE